MSAHVHLKQGIASPAIQQYRSYISGHDSGMACQCFVAWTLWFLGYPDQALQQSLTALTLARELSHPFSMCFAMGCNAWLHQVRRERQHTQEHAAEVMVFATEQGFPYWVAWATALRGWTLVEHGQIEEGIKQIRQGMTTFQSTGAEVWQQYYLTLLAEAYGKGGQPTEGVHLLTKALGVVHTNKWRVVLRSRVVSDRGGVVTTAC